MTVPVFVDGSGRRRRLATFVGVALGAGLLLVLVVIAVGFFSGSPVQLPGLTGAGDAQPGEVRQPAPAPAPGGSVPAPRTPSAGARVSGSGTRTVAPLPGGTNTAGTSSPTPRRHGGPSRSHPGPPK